MKQLLFGLSILLFFGCTRGEDKKFLVTRIRAAAKLAAMEIVLNKIVIGENVARKQFLQVFRGPSLNTVVFDTEATVKYGIRLDKIRNEDISLKNDSIPIAS